MKSAREIYEESVLSEVKVIKTKKSSITFPFLIDASDYHYFEDFANSLSKVIKSKIKYNELNHFEDEDDYDPRTKKFNLPYVAEFYI